MRQLYRKIYGNKVNKDADTEIRLESNNGSKMVFYRFKKEGRKAYQYPDKHNVNYTHSNNSKNISNRGSSQGRRKFNGICSRKKRVIRMLIVGTTYIILAKVHHGIRNMEVKVRKLD